LSALKRYWIARFVLAAIAGGIVGLAIHSVVNLKGSILFFVVGIAAGLAVAILAQIYVRSVSLTEIKVYVPQISELTFVVNSDARRTAWELFVEVSTRVSSQPLSQGEGYLREALDSLYELFGHTRDLLRHSQPTRVRSGQSVEYFALTMLNQQLRPFLAKWHPRLGTFEKAGGEDESTWPENAAFRAELEAMRQNLLQFALGFGRLAGVQDPEVLIQAEDSG
jgi:hypothetical protein